MISDYISKLAERKDLTFDEAKDLMNEITSGNVSGVQIAAILMGLRLKGETSEEIAAFARVMRDKASRINPRVQGRLTDTCGTGAAELKTINVSTISAFVAAGVGVRIAKHGNRSITSVCGSADLVEALGANISLSPEQVEKVIEKVGIGFLFAPMFHPAMKYALGPRRELGIRTVFNILGPLTNPANVKGQLLGVYSESLIDRVAGALSRLEVEKALVVHGVDGLDELSTLGKTLVAEVTNGEEIKRYELFPENFGFQRGIQEQIAGSDPQKSAQVAKRILNGEKGPMRDIVLFNSAATIYVGGKVDEIKDGIEAAAECIDSGKALRKLEEFIEATRGF